MRADYEFLLKRCKNKAKLFLPASLFLLFSFYGVKILLQRYGLMHLQFMIHIIEIMFLIAFLAWMLSIEDSISKFAQKRCWKVVSYLSNITLENYLLMDFVIWKIYNLKLRFPYSYICVFAITLISARLLRLLAGKVSSFLFRKETL